MNWLEVLGYSASALTFMTFLMRAMLPLRYVALCSNVAFIVYGYFSGLTPVLVLHLMLFPLNFSRMCGLLRLTRAVNQAGTADVSIEPLLPYMTRRRFHAGSVLFRRGDAACEMYYILDGSVCLEETGRQIGRGQVAGIIGLFAPGRRRPWTAICSTDADILVLSDKQLMLFAYENPQFTMSLTRLIAQRALTDTTAA